MAQQTSSEFEEGTNRSFWIGGQMAFAYCMLCSIVEVPGEGCDLLPARMGHVVMAIDSSIYMRSLPVVGEPTWDLA
jgi:hypothetical protein